MPSCTPSSSLLSATLLVVAISLALPFTRVAPAFGFTSVPASFVALMSLIVVLYVVSAELAKRWFYKTLGA